MFPADAVEDEGRYYKVYNESLSWNEAKAACEELGGHLATITTNPTTTTNGEQKSVCSQCGHADQICVICGECHYCTSWGPNCESVFNDSLVLWCDCDANQIYCATCEQCANCCTCDNPDLRCPLCEAPICPDCGECSNSSFGCGVGHTATYGKVEVE